MVAVAAAAQAIQEVSAIEPTRSLANAAGSLRTRPGLIVSGDAPYGLIFTGLPLAPDFHAASVSWITFRNSSGGV